MLSLVLLVAAVSVATGRSPPSTMFGVTLNMGGKHDVSAVGLIDTATGNFTHTQQFSDADSVLQSGTALLQPGLATVAVFPDYADPYFVVFNVSAGTQMGQHHIKAPAMQELRCLPPTASAVECFAFNMGATPATNHLLRINPVTGAVVTVGPAMTHFVGLTEDSSAVEAGLYHITLMRDDANATSALVTIDTATGNILANVAVPGEFSGPMCVDETHGLVTLGAGTGDAVVSAVDWKTGALTTLRPGTAPLTGVPGDFAVSCVDGYLVAFLIDGEKNVVEVLDLQLAGAPSVSKAFTPYIMHAVFPYA